MASHYDRRAASTIWRMPDALWADCQALLPPEKPPGTRGRPAVPFRRVLDGILHVLRTGWQRKAAPRALGSRSTVRARFQGRTRQGVWGRLAARPVRPHGARLSAAYRAEAAAGRAVRSAPVGGSPPPRPAVGHRTYEQLA